MDFNGRGNTRFALAVEPASGFVYIEDLALVHQAQKELIRNPIPTAVRAIPLLPRAMTLNAFRHAGTDKTTHGDHPLKYLLVAREPVGTPRRKIIGRADETGILST